MEYFKQTGKFKVFTREYQIYDPNILNILIKNNDYPIFVLDDNTVSEILTIKGFIIKGFSIIGIRRCESDAINNPLRVYHITDLKKYTMDNNLYLFEKFLENPNIMFNPEHLSAFKPDPSLQYNHIDDWKYEIYKNLTINTCYDVPEYKSFIIPINIIPYIQSLLINNETINKNDLFLKKYPYLIENFSKNSKRICGRKYEVAFIKNYASFYIFALSNYMSYVYILEIIEEEIQREAQKENEIIKLKGENEKFHEFVEKCKNIIMN